MSVPQFDELHVISDLHMGGDHPDKQIFKEGPRLGAFIDHLTQKPTDRKVGLVINGDMVDFIAEPRPVYFDTHGAIGRLERIYGDRAFAPVFQALERFLRKAGRSLVIVLGNHDVELALPPVRHWLVERLSGGDDAARGRLTTVFDGTGYLSDVGGKSVLCLHGNETDGWNVVDYRLLLVMSREVNRKKSTTEWDACAGTHMVIDAMNDIKKDFPFVDLLKPEVEATLAIVLTVVSDPFQLEYLGKAARIAKKLARDNRRIDDQLLGAPVSTAPEADVPEERANLSALRDFVRERYGAARTPAREGDLLDEVFDDLQEGRDPMEVEREDDEELLGMGSLVATRLLERVGLRSEGDKREKLREELREALEQDRSFDLSYGDTEFGQLSDLAGPIDYVVTGHTHLARALTRDAQGSAPGYYYNSGTWARLMELPKNVLESADEFGRVYDAFKTHTLTKLDGVTVTKDPPERRGDAPDPDHYDFDDPDQVPGTQRPFVRIRPFVVTIEVGDHGGVIGQLQRVRADGSLRPLAGTQYPR